MTPVISPRSLRTFFDALDLAGFAPPARHEEIGERFLDLLVAGVDHELVGTDIWFRRILTEAPSAAQRLGGPGSHPGPS
jgi:hypothetical protein